VPVVKGAGGRILVRRMWGALAAKAANVDHLDLLGSMPKRSRPEMLASPPLNKTKINCNTVKRKEW